MSLLSTLQKLLLTIQGDSERLKKHEREQVEVAFNEISTCPGWQKQTAAERYNRLRGQYETKYMEKFVPRDYLGVHVILPKERRT